MYIYIHIDIYIYIWCVCVCARARVYVYGGLWFGGLEFRVYGLGIIVHCALRGLGSPAGTGINVLFDWPWQPSVLEPDAPYIIYVCMHTQTHTHTHTHT